jgi:hypothetical protein
MYKSYLVRRYIVLTIIVLTTMIASPARSQSVLEAGPLIGISWYNGDLNPQQQFYRVHPSAGVLVRYVLNDRIAFNASGSIAGISGAYPANNVVLPQANGGDYRFNRNLGDITAKMELNFFSFDHPFNKKSVLTPYLTFGIGSIFYKRYLQENGNDSEKPVFVLSLPFGGGVKWKATNSLKLGLEWTLRKTFVDDLDLVGFGNPVDPSDPYGFNESVGSHNNDWISVFAASVTFTLKYRSGDCNAGF